MIRTKKSPDEGFSRGLRLVGWYSPVPSVAVWAAFNRFLFPNVLYEPPTTFKVGPPEEFGVGMVDERFKESNGVWIVNSDSKLYALVAVCTHLGCPPNWLGSAEQVQVPLPWQRVLQGRYKFRRTHAAAAREGSDLS